MKYLIAPLMLIALMLTMGCFTLMPDPDHGPTSDGSRAPAQMIPSGGSVSGTGSRSKPISLNQGAVTFNLSIQANVDVGHFGSYEGNFIVRLKDSDGNHAGTSLSNVIASSYNSSCTRSISGGQYYLDVECSPGGRWTIRWN